jgi:hypothetical protein
LLKWHVHLFIYIISLLWIQTDHLALLVLDFKGYHLFMKFTCDRLNWKICHIQGHWDPLMVLKPVLSQALKPDSLQIMIRCLTFLQANWRCLAVLHLSLNRPNKGKINFFDIYHHFDSLVCLGRDHRDYWRPYDKALTNTLQCTSLVSNLISIGNSLIIPNLLHYK